MRNLEREHLNGQFSVYPGHPIVIAYLVTFAYPNLTSALTPDIQPDGAPYGWPSALGNNDIPGAGGCVHSGLYVLKRIRDGLTVKQSLEQADQTWGQCDNQKTKDPKRWQE